MNYHLNNNFRNNYIFFEDIQYGDLPLQEMDIYTSRKSINNQKSIYTIIFIHGGAYFQSDKKDELRYITPYLEKGFDVVNINYRIKKGMFVATEDVVKALNFLSSNNSIFELNLKRVLLKGFSSGAHMAANIGLMANKKVKPFDIPLDIQYCAIINISGPSHSLKEIETLFLNAEEKNLREIGNSFFPPHKKYSKQQIIQFLEPVNHSDNNSPPVLLWIGGRDKEIPPFTHIQFIQKMRSNKKNRVIFMENANHIPSDDELDTLQNEIWKFIDNLSK